MNNPKKLYGLILAGGFSRRMGKDKSLLNYHGKPQIEYVHNLLQELCDKVFLSKRIDQPSYKTTPSINDVEPFLNKGPLGGILSAMKSFSDVSWLVLACDLPFVTKETLQTLKLDTDLTSFVPVSVSEKNGQRFAQIISTGGSGDFSALAQATGFIEYEQSQKTLWPYFSWRV